VTRDGWITDSRVKLLKVAEGHAGADNVEAPDRSIKVVLLRYESAVRLMGSLEMDGRNLTSCGDAEICCDSVATCQEERRLEATPYAMLSFLWGCAVLVCRDDSNELRQRGWRRAVVQSVRRVCLVSTRSDL
jgi:hypothetical protein